MIWIRLLKLQNVPNQIKISASDNKIPWKYCKNCEIGQGNIYVYQCNFCSNFNYYNKCL